MTHAVETERKPKVTMLVAVYNSERYIAKCLDSMLAQTMPDFQVVCVDDASTDSSADIIRQYAEKDNRVELVLLERNQGIAHARNVGLQRAKGDYVGFLDSDDWLAEDCLQCMVECFATNSLTDCVLLDSVYVYPDHAESYNMPTFEHLTGREAFEASLTWTIHGIYAIKADIHQRYPYDESAKAYSDENTTRLHYLMSREVRACCGKYFYRQHGDSVTHKPGRQRFDYLKANASMKKSLVELGMEDAILDVYENVRWLNVVDSMYYIYVYRDVLSAEDVEMGKQIIKDTIPTIETQRLRRKNKWKFGYIPIKCSWQLFWLEEHLYFRLRDFARGVAKLVGLGR